MEQNSSGLVPDNTPIIVGAGQFTEHLPTEGEAPLRTPMDLAAIASKSAIDDAGGTLRGSDIDTIAVIRLFSDTAPIWACPFGRSNNPPESIARQIGAVPERRIYSTPGGTQPLQLMAELFTDIARGEVRCALLAGAEAIASQRHAQRSGLSPDWSEDFDQPLDTREYVGQFASPQELASGMYLPAHYYALAENYRAWQQGNNQQQHRRQMAQLFAPMSEVASQNPYAYRQQAYSVDALMSDDKSNYAICLPYTKKLVAQDGVNQAAALVLTSAGFARERGIDPSQWIFLQGYAEGGDQVLSQRVDPGTSRSMQRVFDTALESAQVSPADMDLIDIYSCFPCAVESACDALGLPIDGSKDLTVTGGLPYFGGPGNNYSMHALAEMTTRLRGTSQRALVTANGGQLTNHAAAVLANSPAAAGAAPLDLQSNGPSIVARETIPLVPVCDTPETGTVITYTVIYERKKNDVAVVLAETGSGERFLAHSAQPEVVTAIQCNCPIGRRIKINSVESRHQFSFCD